MADEKITPEHRKLAKGARESRQVLKAVKTITALADLYEARND